MWGTWVVLVALCLAGNVGVSSEDVMGHLHWCNTLCMCEDTTQVEVKCFERNDIYDLLGLNRIMVFKLEQTNWKLENKVLWCNDTCLCHQNADAKVFECVEGESLHQFISSKIGDMYFYKEGEESERQEEEEARKIEHRKRSDERRKNRRNRKTRKRGKNRQEPPAVVTEKPTTPTPQIVPTMILTSPEPEVVSVMTQDEFSSTQTPTFEILTSGLPTQMPTTSESTFLTTELTPFEPDPEPEGPEIVEEEEEEEEEGGSHEEDADELLPKHEAVAASPAVTAMQPPTRRQPFPPTVSSHAATREAETLAPKVSAVLEVPVQRKTVASEVSQDLDELGSAVMQIKSDVVLNQRILLVTVAVAGIAMLGVLMLAVHSCFASKRQAAAEERRQKETPKDDNHVTKVNLEEAW